MSDEEYKQLVNKAEVAAQIKILNRQVKGETMHTVREELAICQQYAQSENTARVNAEKLCEARGVEIEQLKHTIADIRNERITAEMLVKGLEGNLKACEDDNTALQSKCDKLEAENIEARGNVEKCIRELGEVSRQKGKLEACCAEMRRILPKPAWDNRVKYVRCPLCNGDIDIDNGKENGHEESCRLRLFKTT